MVGWRSMKRRPDARRPHHDDDRQHERRAMITPGRPAHRREHRIEREHDIDERDLGRRRVRLRPRGRCAARACPLERLVDLGDALSHQEQAAGQESDRGPKGAIEAVNSGAVRRVSQTIENSSARRVSMARDRPTTRARLTRGRHLTDQNRQNHHVVDAQHDLEQRQGREPGRDRVASADSGPRPRLRHAVDRALDRRGQQVLGGQAAVQRHGTRDVDRRIGAGDDADDQRLEKPFSTGPPSTYSATTTINVTTLVMMVRDSV